MQAVGFYFFYGFIWLFTLLPTNVQYCFSSLLFYLIYYVFGYRKHIVDQNLRNAFPGKTEGEIRLISKNYYRHMCDELMEAFQLIHFTPKQILRHYRYKNPELLQKYSAENRSVVLVFGHYGNWEWITSLPLVVSHKVLAVYNPLKNKYFDKMLYSLRSKFGAKPIPSNRILQEILVHHQQKIPVITLLLGDQRPRKKYVHYWTTFLNQDTPVFLGVEKISSKLNHAVVFMNISKIKRGYYELEFIPLFDNPAETQPYEITEGHVRLLEEYIRRKPDYWLWSHRRWRHKKPVEKV